ncbi:hypothetical protein ES703_81384 [subsurface metagenome]
MISKEPVGAATPAGHRGAIPPVVHSFPQPGQRFVSKDGTSSLDFPWAGLDNKCGIQDNKKKGGDTMTMEGFFTGQPLDGRQIGSALFQLGPTLPHESPVPMPRALAKVLFPRGFIPWQPFVAAAPARPAAPLVPPVPPAPAAPAAPPVNRVDERGNQVLRTQVMPKVGRPPGGGDRRGMM